MRTLIKLAESKEDTKMKHLDQQRNETRANVLVQPDGPCTRSIARARFVSGGVRAG